MSSKSCLTTPDILNHVCLHHHSAIVLVDRTGELQFLNIAAEALFGVQLSDTAAHIDTHIAFSNSDVPDATNFADIISRLNEDNNHKLQFHVIYSANGITHLHVAIQRLVLPAGNEVFSVHMDDASDHMRIKDTYLYKETLLDQVLSNSKDALIAFDETGGIELFSPAAERIFDVTSAEMLIEDVFVLFDPMEISRVKQMIDDFPLSFALNHPHIEEDIKCVRSNGLAFPASLVLTRSSLAGRDLFILRIADLTSLKTFVNSLNDAYIKTDACGRIIDCNDKARILFGLDKLVDDQRTIQSLGIKPSSQHDCIDSFKFLTNQKNSAHSRNEDSEHFIAKTVNGQNLFITMTVWPHDVRNNNVFHAIITDVTQKIRDQEQLKITAHHDSLTGLPNRGYFNTHLLSKISENEDSQSRFALLMLDLDNFKTINDTMGHDVGDDLLVAVAGRLKKCLRQGDLVARIGGDEFTIILDQLDDKHTVAEISSRIIDQFSNEFCLKDKSVSTSTSIGVAIYPEHGRNLEDLIKAADIAMYQAKKVGRDACVKYTHGLREKNQRRLTIESLLRTAVQNNELALHYQPKICTKAKKLYGLEALIRWECDAIEALSPAEFIPIAEKSGSIVELSHWVFNNAISQFKRWQQEACFRQQPITLAINVSTVHFNADLVSDLISTIQRCGVDPSTIEVEVTETQLMENFTVAAETITALSKLGVKVSVDDFGTGYSSLRYLSKLPIDTLKIDQSFIKSVQENKVNQSIIEAILLISKRLDLNIVAEGVEMPEELTHLALLGCEKYQGFLFSRPLQSVGVLDFIKKLPDEDFWRYLPK